MKIETVKEIQETTLEVNDALTIELRQKEYGLIEIRLIPHYSDRVYFVVHDWEGKPQSMPLEAANQAVLNQFVPDPNNISGR